MPETHHPTSGVVLTAAGEQMFKPIIDKLEKCEVPLNAAGILTRYIEHFRYVTAHDDAAIDQMYGLVHHVIELFPKNVAFRMLPRMFAAIAAYREGDYDKAAATLLCVECALDLKAA
jgi:hypothetical protein